MTGAALQHWKVQSDADRICWLTLDRADSKHNTLSHTVLQELGQILDEISDGDLPSGLVIRSGKPTGFVMGADVNEFVDLDDAAEASRLARFGQDLLARISRLDCPTVAAIDGYALGGGLEMALACDYRVAVESYERTLGLPEVQLGIHPGFGGTVRTIELLGAPKALDLMLTGRSLSPVEAVQAGLIDHLCGPEALADAAAQLIEKRPRPRRAPWHLRLLDWGPVRRLVAQRIRRQVARRARQDQYPAPFAIVDLWQEFGARGEAAFGAEVDSIGRLLVGRTSKNLVRVFLLRERLRNLAPKSDTVASVHVVGSGVMGGDIAAWCALKGLTVTVQDRALEYVEPALARAAKLFERRLKAPGAAAAARDRLTVDLEGRAVGSADVVIEAIVEDSEAKRELFRGLEQSAPQDGILATNTSSIRIEDIASALTHPERLVGVHFFNPVAQMPLVEVIRGPETSDAVVQQALSFVTQIGKLPLPCRSAPGFVVNRVLMPYMLESLEAHAEGHALETIDAAAKAFGMPMGPIELADRVGLDVALHVASILADVYGRQPPRLLEERVEQGRLGAKVPAGGFYLFENGRAKKSKQFARPTPELQDRLILPLINEAIACYADGVVDDTDLLDAGIVFGTGFAPHTGGPVQYARQRGFAEIEQRLKALAETHGPRFEPHHGWSKIASLA